MINSLTGILTLPGGCMRKILLVCSAIAIFSTQIVFADVPSAGKDCDTIAKACLDAGFNRNDEGDKMFWQNCMRPILMGKSVSGVTVDAMTVKACRKGKIEELKKEIKDLQSVRNK